MYAIKQFKVIPPKETLITLLDAEEANRLVLVDRLDKAISCANEAEGLARYYKRLTVLLALLMVLLALTILSESVCLLGNYF